MRVTNNVASFGAINLSKVQKAGKETLSAISQDGSLRKVLPDNVITKTLPEPMGHPYTGRSLEGFLGDGEPAKIGTLNRLKEILMGNGDPGELTFIEKTDGANDISKVVDDPDSLLDSAGKFLGEVFENITDLF